MTTEATPTGGAVERQPMTVQQAALKLEERRQPPPKEEKTAKPPQSNTPAEETELSPAPSADETNTGDVPADEGVETPPDDAEPVEAAAVDVQALSKLLGIPSDDISVDSDGTVSVKTKVDGQDGTVKLPDLRKSYQLESSFTHKSMQLAEERKQFQDASDQAAHKILGRQAELEGAINLAAQMLHGQYATVDWAKLEAEDPVQFALTTAQFKRHQQSLNGLWQTLQKGEKERSDTLKTQYEDWAKKQTLELVNHVPEWKDPKVAQEALTGIFATAKADYGITDPEIGQLMDNRYVRILKDAVAYRKLQSQQSGVMQRVNKAPALAKPGTTGKPNTTPAKDARAKLSSTHSMNDAVDALLARRQQTRK